MGVADVLAVYLAGVMSLPATTSRDGSVRLSSRQAQVLQLLQEDLTMQQIAAGSASASPRFAWIPLSIYRALGVHDRTRPSPPHWNLGLITRPGAPAR